MAGGLAACGGTSPITASQGAPDIAAPSTTPTMPSVTMPPTTPSTPGTTSPGTTSPGTTSPGTTSPGTSAPGTTAPVTTIPGGGSPSTSAPINARAVLRRALANARAERWVNSESANSDQTEGINTVGGPTSGTQTVFSENATGHIIVVPGATYIHGTAAALTDLFGVPSAQAGSLASHWVKLVPGNSQYATTTEGVTLPSLMAPLALTGDVKGGTVTASDGTQYDLITGTIPKGTGYGNGTETGQLAVTTGNHPLPYEFQVTSSGGALEWSYGNWGKVATVTPPSGAVPLPH